ncbi:MAG: hypothetical protein RMJ86_02080 [Anaerolineae bacterium]|nr:hypothetical protein [Thermoflexales bacterium]MDW8053320.1 hypothetical protein [Anaerolineae bacterium]
MRAIALGRSAGAARAYSLFAAIPALLMGAALVALAFHFVVLLVYARALLNFPFDYDQGEGFELYDAIRLARGEHIYLDNAQFPFYSSNYPPVYRLLLAPLVAVFGPNIAVGRAVTLTAALIAGVAVASAAWRMWSASAPFALRASLSSMAALAFFAANDVYHIAPLARAHILMVMFSLAGALVVNHALEARSPRAAVLGVVLLMLAGYTKLQAVDVLVAGFGLLLLRRPRWFVWALAICLAFTLAFVLGMNALTAGQFWINVVAANVNEYDLAVTGQTYVRWLRLQAPLIVGGVAYVMWDVVRAWRARSTQPLTVWSLYFLTSSAMGMLTGKWGAGPAYLVSSIAVGAVCTAGVLGRAWAKLHARRVAAASALVGLMAGGLFLIQAALNLHLPTSGRFFGTVARWLGVAEQQAYPPYAYYDSSGYTQLGHLPLPADVNNGWALVQRLREVEGPVWSEEAMFTLLAGKDVVTNPTQLLNLSKNGTLDTSQMIAMIERRAFGAVVFRALFYPDDVKAAIFRNYYWAQKFDINGFEYWLLLPIPSEP